MASVAGRNPMTRCTGHCCRRFTMSTSLDAIQARATDQEGAFIADMLVQLPDGPMWFTCRHYDTVAGDCTVYEQRPAMCRRYGTDAQPCDHEGCTKADNGVVPDLVQLRVAREATLADPRYVVEDWRHLVPNVFPPIPDEPPRRDFAAELEAEMSAKRNR